MMMMMMMMMIIIIIIIIIIMCTIYGSIFSALASLFPLEFAGNPRVLKFKPFQAARVWGVSFPTKLNWKGQAVKSATAFVSYVIITLL